MFLRAFVAMVSADAFDRHMREQQYRAWVAAEEARVAADPRARPLFVSEPSAFDPRWPERPT
jgi:hypothetical protein